MLHEFKDKKIYFCSDSDLDGVSATILAIYYLYPIAKNLTLLNTADRDLKNFNYSILSSYDTIIFCDIAPPNIDFYNRLIDNNITVYIFDHHITSKENLGELKNYYFNNNVCGSKIFFDNITKNIEKKENITQYVELVNIYDMWKENDPLFALAHDMHNILYSYVDWSFRNHENEFFKVEKYILAQYLKFNKYNNFFLLEKEKQSAVETRFKEIAEYKKCKKNIQFRIDNSGNKYAFFSCYSKISWMSHLLLKEYQNIAYIVGYSTFIKDKYKISLRSKNFNVEQIAKKWGGGGHEHAAGIEFKDKEIFDNIVSGKQHLI
jgi:oligoribonuclease NrnB/cAMP/cGMP phosphodiesterase (DHH superfamily)